MVRSAMILEPSRKPGTFNTKFGSVLPPNATLKRPGLGEIRIEHTNSLGFRTREIEPRLPGEYRVLLLGDSYFYGAYVSLEETVAVQLERMSASDDTVRRPLRVYNFAVPGYCTVQELIVGQAYAPRVEPDAIILGFFAGNDLIPNALTQIDDMGNFSPVDELVERFRHDLRAELGPWRHSVIARTLFVTGPSSTRLFYRLGRQTWVLEQNERILGQFARFCRERRCRYGVVFQHTVDSLASGWRGPVRQSGCPARSQRVLRTRRNPVRGYAHRVSRGGRLAAIHSERRRSLLCPGRPQDGRGDLSTFDPRRTRPRRGPLRSRRDVVFFHHVATDGGMRLRSTRIGRRPMIHGSNESIELAMTDARPVWPDPQWSLVGPEYPKDQCIHEIVENHVRGTPDAVAVVFEDEWLSYRELNRRAEQAGALPYGCGSWAGSSGRALP